MKRLSRHVKTSTTLIFFWFAWAMIARSVNSTDSYPCVFADYYYMRLLKLDASKIPEIPQIVRLSEGNSLILDICPRGPSILQKLCPDAGSEKLVGIYLDETNQKCLGYWTRENVHAWTMHREQTGSVSFYLSELANNDPGLLSIELNYKTDSSLQAMPVVYQNFASPDETGFNIKIGIQDSVIWDSATKLIFKILVSGAINNVFWIVLIGLTCNSRTKFLRGKIAPLNLLMIYIICDRTNNGVIHVLDVLGYFSAWILICSYSAYILQFIGMYWIFQNTSPMNTYKFLLPLFIGITAVEWLLDSLLSTRFLFILNLFLLGGLFSFKKLIKSPSKGQEWSLCVALAVQVPIALHPWIVPYKSSRFRLFLNGLQAMYTSDDFILRYSLQNFIIILFSILRYGSILLKDRSEDRNYKNELDSLKGWVQIEHTPNASLAQTTGA